MNDRELEMVAGSGNVFRDFGDPDADLKQAKAVVAARLITVLDRQKLTVRKAATLTGFAAADFSRVRNADLSRFTLDRLLRMLGSLDERSRATIRIESREPEHAAFATAHEDRG